MKIKEPKSTRLKHPVLSIVGKLQHLVVVLLRPKPFWKKLFQKTWILVMLLILPSKL
jgi:hypothetical protein